MVGKISDQGGRQSLGQALISDSLGAHRTVGQVNVIVSASHIHLTSEPSFDLDS